MSKTSKEVMQRFFRSKKGVITRVYASMRNRVKGNGNSWRLPKYKGLVLLPRSLFVEWSNASRELASIHEAWVLSGFDRELVPSINRIDNTKGYSLDNIEWVTWRVNRAGSRGNVKLTKEQVAEIKRRFKPYDPVNGRNALAKEFGVDPSMIRLIVRGKSWRYF